MRELADGGAITPATEAATDPTGPWSPLQTLPQSGVFFPAPRQFQFKKREIEKANTPQSSPVDHHELIAAANRTPPGTGAPIPAPPNDVVQILEGVARKQAAHEAPLEIRRRSNRRLHDYLFLMIPLNALFVAALIWNGLHNPTVFVGLVAVFGMLNACLIWIIFFVMDRY